MDALHLAGKGTDNHRKSGFRDEFLDMCAAALAFRGRLGYNCHEIRPPVSFLFGDKNYTAFQVLSQYIIILYFNYFDNNNGLETPWLKALVFICETSDLDY
jgi:hypothetical protein